MHPPLDRPHPDCQEAIRQLRDCHNTNPWGKYLGTCNDIKFQLDRCLREEKKRALQEVDRDLPARRSRQEEIIKDAFGKDMTFSQFLEQDADYQRERQRKKEAAKTS